jgi:hypothetical protein
MKSRRLLERRTMIADRPVKLYSTDGKNWSTDQSALKEYQKRRRRAIRVTQELMKSEWVNDEEN